MSQAPDPITQTLREESGGRVLDLATGRAIFLEYLLDTLSGIRLAVGADADPQATAASRSAMAKTDVPVYIVRMDAAALGFKDAAFDTVGLANSLHHLPNLDRAFTEIRRTLRPGGRCVISEMFRDDQTPAQKTHVRLHHWAAAIDRARGISHRETYTQAELLDLVDQLDLEELDVFTYAALDEDPHDPETVDNLATAIERLTERALGLSGEASLRRQADQLKVRLRDVGYHPATQLIAIGRKAG